MAEQKHPGKRPRARAGAADPKDADAKAARLARRLIEMPEPQIAAPRAATPAPSSPSVERADPVEGARPGRRGGRGGSGD